jgi:hypothetical protein
MEANNKEHNAYTLKEFNIYTKININKEIISIDKIKAYINRPHGVSLTTLSMIDPNNKKLDIEINTNDYNIYLLYNSQIPIIYYKYIPSPCLIRSYKKNNIFISEYGADVEGKNAYTNLITDTQYGDKKNIIDIVEESNQSIYYIYRWLEQPRKLIINYNN